MDTWHHSIHQSWICLVAVKAPWYTIKYWEMYFSKFVKLCVILNIVVVASVLQEYNNKIPQILGETEIISVTTNSTDFKAKGRERHKC